MSPYAASKKAAEVLAYSYHALHGLDVSVLRFFTVYGPAGRPDMSVFRFVRQIAEGETLIVYGDGSQLRDFTYVEDIARGTIAAGRPLGYEVINLGGDRPVPLNEVDSPDRRALGSRAAYRIPSRPRGRRSANLGQHQQGRPKCSPGDRRPRSKQGLAPRSTGTSRTAALASQISL